MADQAGYFVPYHDTYDGPYDDDILSLMDDTNPVLAELPQLDGPSNFHPHNSMPTLSNDAIEEVVDHPIEDPTLWNFGNEFDYGSGSKVSLEACPTGLINGEMGNLETQNNNPSNVYTEPLSIWPLPPAPYYCSCCQVLREIIHINGQIYLHQCTD